MNKQKREELKDRGWTDEETEVMLDFLRREVLEDRLAVRLADIVAARRWQDATVTVDEPGCAWAGAHRG